MNWTAIFLRVNALIFIVFGSVCLFKPDMMLAGIGAVISGGDGLYEMRGIYGGVSLGAGLLCALGSFKAPLRRPALIFLLTYTGGYLIGRVVGFGLDGLPQPKFFVFIAFEAFTALLAYALLRKAG